MFRPRSRAGHIGVEPFDPVRKPGLDQKRQRAVGDRRLGAMSVPLEPPQDIVGASRRVIFKQDLENPAPGRSQPQAAIGAHGFSSNDGRAHAAGVIVR